MQTILQLEDKQFNLLRVFVTDLPHNIQTRVGALSTLCIVGTQGCFPRGKVARGMKLTTHLQLVLRLRMVELYFDNPTQPSSLCDASFIKHVITLPLLLLKIINIR